jgi:hypothetical protein
MIVQPAAALPCAMLIAAIFLGHWLGNKKNIILDFIVALIVLLILIYVGFQVVSVLR